MAASTEVMDCHSTQLNIDSRSISMMKTGILALLPDTLYLKLLYIAYRL